MRSNRIIAAISFASVSICIAIATAQQPEQAPAPASRQPEGRPGRGPGEAPNVEASMKSMNRALSQLKEQLGDSSKKDACLKLIGDAQRGCIAAKSGRPHALDDIKEEAARAKAAESFRRHLMAVARKLLDIEQNILDGKTDAARAQIAEVVKMRDEGHKELGVDEG